MLVFPSKIWGFIWHKLRTESLELGTQGPTYTFFLCCLLSVKHVYGTILLRPTLQKLACVSKHPRRGFLVPRVW